MTTPPQNTTSSLSPPIWLHGEHVALGPFTRDLVQHYWRWEQDPRVLVGYGRQTPDSLEGRIAGYESQARNTADQARFTIYYLTAADEPNRPPHPVGTTALRIDHYVRTAEYVILLGEEGRGRHLATEATRLTLDYGFHITNLRAIWLKVLEHNTNAIHAYTAAGFHPAGRLRHAGYWLGEACDELLMDVVKDDLPGPSLVHRIMQPPSATP